MNTILGISGENRQFTVSDDTASVLRPMADTENLPKSDVEESIKSRK